MNYSAFNYYLPANSPQRIEQAGTSVFIRGCIGEITVKFESPSEDAVILKSGETVLTSGFHQFFLESPINQTIKIIVSSNNSLKVDGVVVVGSLVISQEIAPVDGDNNKITLTLANTDYALLASNASRKNVVIQADSANVGIILLGVEGSTIANGLELVAGQAITLESGISLKGRSTSAGQIVRVLQDFWV